MKVTNWRRKLSAALMAGGLLVPSAAMAAPTGANLVANSGFENVDGTTLGDYSAPRILDWLGGPAFAYSHQPGLTSVPDYADGADPPDAGNWYFTSNNNPSGATGDWRNPDEVYQDIDVSFGQTGAIIPFGNAVYTLSAFMSSYLNDDDAGNVQVDFKNSGGTTIGTALISDPDFGDDNVWSLSAVSGLVPPGTSTVRVSIFGTPRNGGADGYIDNVSFIIVPEPATMLLVGMGLAGAGVLRRRRPDES
jgi:PEP-CTERM motif